MRKLTKIDKRRSDRDDKMARERPCALNLIKGESYSVRRVAALSGVSETTCRRIKLCNDNGDVSGLEKLLNPASNRAGGRPHLTTEQENIITERLILAGKRGFAAETKDLKSLMAQSAEVNGRPYRNGLPCDDAVRPFRSKHREVALRNYESKDNEKIKGERFEHVESFFKILEDIGKQFPGILTDGDRVWNLDETKVDPEFGKKIKVYGDSSSHHGGFRASTTSSGTGRHVTAVIAVSASGKRCPPFFIVQGKQVMSNWLDPLDSDTYRKANEDIVAALKKKIGFLRMVLSYVPKRGLWI